LLLLGALALIPSACGDSPTDPGDNGDPNGGTPYAHDRSAGASAADLLSDTDFQHLVVEVQYVEGMAPEQTALDDLADFLEARLTKPGGIEIRVDDQPIGPATGTTYSAADIRALEAEHREIFTSGDTLATYLLVVDGEYEQENVLGIAYYNTSTALFGEKIQDNTGGLGQPSKARVEATVAMHEFGHIMGLVDNGTDMVTEHKDPEPGRGSHCDDDGCLMYYAVRTTDFLSNLLDSAPPPLDQNCVDDLRANGGR
ncbi:MAG: hypothetical protein WEA34_13365, partial [Gemmatimonadota bacterium]